MKRAAFLGVILAAWILPAWDALPPAAGGVPAASGGAASGGAASGGAASGGAASGSTPPAPLQVILHGTGYPRPEPERAGPATAVVCDGKVYLVDAGRGVLLRLAATELPLKSIQAVFLTHLHSDHTSGLPDLFATSWIFGRNTPLELYGPRGTQPAARALEAFYAADTHIRRDLVEMLPGAGATIRAHEIEEGPIYEDAAVRITAFAVDHHPVEPAFGYRFDARGKSVVISGDTRPSENLIRHARGADVLVHEAYLPEHFDRVDTPAVAARLKSYHSSAEEAGQVASRAGVKLLVLTHLVPGGPEKTFLERAGKYFSGKIVVGRDLMRFDP
jgi:ribonuclease Z